MPDFTVMFSKKLSLNEPSPLEKLREFYNEVFGKDEIHINNFEGASIIFSTSSEKMKCNVIKSNEGWIIYKGIIFDVISNDPVPDPKKIHENIFSKDIYKLNRYEGTFACVAWDSKQNRAIFFNDQNSMLNLYYIIIENTLYITTNALSLAKFLRLSLDPYGILEFWYKDSQIAPLTHFRKMKRVAIGENICWASNRLKISNHWSWNFKTNYNLNLSEAAEEVISVTTDRLVRYGANHNRVITDLSGGFDTRVLANASCVAGLNPTVTVVGAEGDRDVLIAKEIAKIRGWKIVHFNPLKEFKDDITIENMMELILRSSGELPLNYIYLHLISRPKLSKLFDLHLIGTGGEFFRTFTWQQILKFTSKRWNDKPFPPDSLFDDKTEINIRNYFKKRFSKIIDKHKNASLFKKLDGMYLWKMTSHSSQYISALYNWYPCAAPFLTAGVIEKVFSTPWQFRIYGQLQRQIIHQLSPQTSKIQTWTHGGTAEPINKSTLPKEIAHLTKNIAWRLDRKLLNNSINKKLKFYPVQTIDEKYPAFLSKEFEKYLDPENMMSRHIYMNLGLNILLNGNISDWRNNANWIFKIATIEAICRELKYEPKRDFLKDIY